MRYAVAGYLTFSLSNAVCFTGGAAGWRVLRRLIATELHSYSYRSGIETWPAGLHFSSTGLFMLMPRGSYKTMYIAQWRR